MCCKFSCNLMWWLVNLFVWFGIWMIYLLVDELICFVLLLFVLLLFVLLFFDLLLFVLLFFKLGFFFLMLFLIGCEVKCEVDVSCLWRLMYSIVEFFSLLIVMIFLVNCFVEVLELVMVLFFLFCFVFFFSEIFFGLILIVIFLLIFVLSCL